MCFDNKRKYHKKRKRAIISLKQKAEWMFCFFVYGFGSKQDNWQNYAQQIGIGLVGNLGGNWIANRAFGRAASPFIRNAFSTASGEATEYAVDGIKNLYHNYNK